MKVTDRMLGDILRVNIDSTPQTSKLLKIQPFFAPNSNEMIKIHIKNLFATYGEESVVYHITEVLKETK